MEYTVYLLHDSAIRLRPCLNITLKNLSQKNGFRIGRLQGHKHTDASCQVLVMGKYKYSFKRWPPFGFKLNPLTRLCPGQGYCRRGPCCWQANYLPANQPRILLSFVSVVTGVLPWSDSSSKALHSHSPVFNPLQSPAPMYCTPFKMLVNTKSDAIRVRK